MLGRIEVAYLATLRVVLLIAATLALLATLGAALMALPALTDLVGLSRHEKVQGGTLREFVDQNRITDVDTSSASEDSEDARLPLPERVAEASKNFARYDMRNGGEVRDQSKWDDVFRALLEQKVPYALESDYGDDILKLSENVSRSKGKPLSDDRVFQLLEYHLDTFTANAQSQATAKATRFAGSMSKLFLAGVSFLIFVLVLFSFLFVKIERNLRLREPGHPSVESIE